MNLKKLVSMVVLSVNLVYGVFWMASSFWLYLGAKQVKINIFKHFSINLNFLKKKP